MKELDQKLNWLRAAVLGANDGVLSIAGIVIGIAAAGVGSKELLLTGLIALVAGAISMAGGEYASVSAQRDSELAHGRELHDVTAHPLAAAFASAAAFTLGGLVPLLIIMIPLGSLAPIITGVSVIVVLGGTGYWAAWVGGASKSKGLMRNIIISILTVVVSYGIGSLLNILFA
jgi:vacuolar iron transporter family protein